MHSVLKKKKKKVKKKENKKPSGLLSECAQGLSLSLLQSERWRLLLRGGHSRSCCLWVCSGACKEVGSLFSPPVTSSCVFQLWGLFIRWEDIWVCCVCLAVWKKQSRTSQTHFLTLFGLAFVFIYFFRSKNSRTPFQSMPSCINWTQPFPVVVFQSELTVLLNVN